MPTLMIMLVPGYTDVIVKAPPKPCAVLASRHAPSYAAFFYTYTLQYFKRYIEFLFGVIFLSTHRIAAIRLSVSVRFPVVETIFRISLAIVLQYHTRNK